MKTKTVRVLRAFYFDRKPTKVGDVIELPAPFALEMCAAHKAEMVEPEVKQEPKEPAKDEGSTKESTKDEGSKGGRHAR